MAVMFMARADVYLLNSASTPDNPSLGREKLTATNLTIPLSLQREETQFLATAGTFVQVMGPEAVEMEMTLFGWSGDFLEAILEIDEEGRVWAKRVGFLIKGKLQTAKSNLDIKEVIFIAYGQFAEGDLLKLEAGNAQESDFTFVLDSLSIKRDNKTVNYNLSGM